MKQFSEYLDVIVEPRYDTVFIPAAGTGGPLTFFSVPVGSGTSVYATASSKTKRDTNMDLSGQLPAGYNFNVLGIRLAPDPAVTQADITLGLAGALFTFTIGSKDFLTVPVQTIPAGVGPAGFYTQTAAATAAIVTWGWPHITNAFNVSRKPLQLQQTQNFKATLTWPGGVGQVVTTTLAGRTTAGAAGLPITCYLDGFLYRVMQ